MYWHSAPVVCIGILLHWVCSIVGLQNPCGVRLEKGQVEKEGEDVQTDVAYMRKIIPNLKCRKLANKRPDLRKAVAARGARLDIISECCEKHTWGQTAMDVACQSGNDSIKIFLRERGVGRQDSHDNPGVARGLRRTRP